MKIYQARWNIFARWCKNKQLDPKETTVQIVADFLQQQYDRGLSIPSIKGYRTAIGQTLLATGKSEVSNSQILTQLVRAYRLERPRPVQQFPDWDLVLVLNSLLTKPYEPMDKCDIEHLAWKTAFLLLLASAKRRGEIHAIDVRRIAFTESYSQVTLYPVPNFIPKILEAAEGGSRFRPIIIPALTQIVGHSKQEPDRLLCPIRAL